MSLKNLSNQNIVKIYGYDQKNTGSSSVQISILTKKINYLQKHFFIHKKDHCGRRGLLKMVSKRRKLLDYMKHKDKKKYFDLIKNLGLRY